MPTWLAFGLLGLGLALPLGIAGIAQVVHDDTDKNTPTWAKIVLIILLVLSIFFLFAIAAYGTGRYDDSMGDFAVVYGICGVAVVIAATVWMSGIYTRPKPDEGSGESEAEVTPIRRVR